jgi:hypothetical protein
MSTFTVKSVMPTGKTHATYGTEFYVQFNEVEQAFPLWFKSAPEIGTTVDGEINGGKFKKIKKEYTPEAPATTSSAAPAARTPYKDNSDGMRQGMCINNAANYVNSLEFPKALTDVEWATTVFSYANALYRLGDLTKAQEGSQVPTTVAGVFGGGEVVTP